MKISHIIIKCIFALTAYTAILLTPTTTNAIETSMAQEIKWEETLTQARTGDIESIFYLYMLSSSNMWNDKLEKQKVATQFLEELVLTGNVQARNWLAGACYSTGTQNENQALKIYTPTRGMKWLKQSAQSGDTRAQIDMALIYLKGACGIPLDVAEALRWLSFAGQRNNDIALTFLSNLYSYGSLSAGGDTSPSLSAFINVKKAIYWARKADDAGVTTAAAKLINCYRIGGDGVKRDIVLAYAIASIAAIRTYPDISTYTDTSTQNMYKQIREDIATDLSREQIQRGQKIASQWRPGKPLPSSSTLR